MPDIKFTTEDGNSVFTYVTPEKYAELSAEQKAIEMEKFEKLTRSIVLAGALANRILLRQMKLHPMRKRHMNGISTKEEEK